jgi:hypothetical protein
MYMLKILTNAEKLVNEQTLAMLEWASDHPDRWHNIGKLGRRGAQPVLVHKG